MVELSLIKVKPPHFSTESDFNLPRKPKNKENYGKNAGFGRGGELFPGGDAGVGEAEGELGGLFGRLGLHGHFCGYGSGGRAMARPYLGLKGLCAVGFCRLGGGFFYYCVDEGGGGFREVSLKDADREGKLQIHRLRTHGPCVPTIR